MLTTPPWTGRGQVRSGIGNNFNQKVHHMFRQQQLQKTSQELRMLSNATLNCQVAKIVMNSGSQLSEL